MRNWKNPLARELCKRVGDEGLPMGVSQLMRDASDELEAWAEVEADHKRLVRELDVLLNGEAGAAKQASLCDIVAQVERFGHALQWKAAVDNHLIAFGRATPTTFNNPRSAVMALIEATRDYHDEGRLATACKSSTPPPAGTVQPKDDRQSPTIKSTSPSGGKV